MSRKSDKFYFDTFIECGEYAVKGVKLLNKTFDHYHPSRLHDLIEEMHTLEHEADSLKHKMTQELARAFVTPIEREDIVELAHHIDNMVDNIEDVMMRLYCDDITEIREDVYPVVSLLMDNYDETLKLIKEFADYKHSKNLKEHIIKINGMEGEADLMFIENMRRLHKEVSDPIQIIVWRDIYTYLERCHDDCEDVAANIEMIILKNS
ncbi:hypothetical protein FC52_GL001777 [Lactobacillus pasteurii DSM 23907 = CRBIP 24.76]|uniref:Phosphate transport regulator n=1 Tax=Lactobacillus pasteurii DSM 23907 = CRBIP 24.76 TaxID=1423790 RepID=I7LAK9_9LACO|nr:DUF47 family protein [Lactobacillus pasteurii]KRK07504.1 hypothetical protein FC52_GL001777 [Lactobacillus pasteurii DSM 23907 = CRBIP 24.76]TDG77047.1 hypothetical protein C5L33_000690 [Lactobacillus pasteurii]CCI84791.1 Phosphate transport regulator [Lactobacillus pasteurii DSM 23907 = CRBIP 24.76]